VATGSRRTTTTEASGVDDALEERLGARLGRRFEDRRRWAFLEDAALMEEAHAVADLPGERHLVGGEQHRHSGRLQPADDVEHLADQFGVERRGDLVEQHHLRVHGERSGDGDPLLLATGELIGIGVGPVGETEPRQHLQAIESCLRLADAEHLARADRDVVDHAHVGEQVEALEHHPDAPPDRVGVEAWLGDVDPVEEHLAVVGRLEQVHAAQQRRLPGAEAPISVITSPTATSRSMPSSTTVDPNDLWMPASTASVPRRQESSRRSCDRRRSGSGSLTGEQPVGEAGAGNREREEDQ
jgi:hypothetical protein